MSLVEIVVMQSIIALSRGKSNNLAVAANGASPSVVGHIY